MTRIAGGGRTASRSWLAGRVTAAVRLFHLSVGDEMMALMPLVLTRGAVSMKRKVVLRPEPGESKADFTRRLVAALDASDPEAPDDEGSAGDSAT